MPEEDGPVNTIKELVGAAPKEELPTARASISTHHQQIGFALLGCECERVGYAAPAGGYNLRFGLDTRNLSSGGGHCGVEAAVLFRDSDEHHPSRLSQERGCVSHSRGRTTGVFPANHNGVGQGPWGRAGRG